MRSAEIRFWTPFAGLSSARFRCAPTFARIAEWKPASAARVSVYAAHSCIWRAEVDLFLTLDHLVDLEPLQPELPVPVMPDSPNTVISLMRTAPGAPLQPSRRLYIRPAPSAKMLLRAQETQIAILTAPQPVVPFVSSTNFDDSLSNFDELNTVGKTNGTKRKALTEIFPCIKRQRQPICDAFKTHSLSFLCAECGFLQKDHNKVAPIVSPRASNRCVAAACNRICYRRNHLCKEHQVKKAPVFKPDLQEIEDELTKDGFGDVPKPKD